jgi:choline dehydrogenase-like flavoprotein
VDEQQVPYTHPADQPFNWVRVRMIGGKSNFWARMSFRLSDDEFKAKDHDGFGENWPIDHATLAPFYERAEAIFRVSGPARKDWLSCPTPTSLQTIRPIPKWCSASPPLRSRAVSQ